MVKIKGYFDEINRTVEKMGKDKILPHFYSIDKLALSLNDLQYDRYYEKHFLYYFTEHRREEYKT